MGLAEAVLEVAADMEDAASFGKDFQPKDVVYWAKLIRACVTASRPEARPIDSIPTVIGGTVYPQDWLKEQEARAKEAAVKRELRDKEDLGLACVRAEVSNRMAKFVGGPLDGDLEALHPSMGEGYQTFFSDSKGTHTYELGGDGNFHLVDPKS